MKSWFRKTVVPGVALIVLAGWSLGAPGGVISPAVSSLVTEQVEPASERTRPAGDRELPAPQEASRAPPAGSVIRCWQGGRLIFEEKDWAGPGQGLPGLAFRSDQGRFGRLQLMSFGETFCFMKHDVRGP